jgi:hypothetical protein
LLCRTSVFPISMLRLVLIWTLVHGLFFALTLKTLVVIIFDKYPPVNIIYLHVLTANAIQQACCFICVISF